MKKTNKGLDIIAEASGIGNRKVCLTRKTNKAGEIRHGVVLVSKYSGRKFKVATFAGISPAWALYKTLTA